MASSDEEEHQEDAPLLPDQGIRNINNGDDEVPVNIYRDQAPALPKRDRPSSCGVCWIVCYVMLLIIALTLAGGGCVLYFIPETNIGQVLVYVPDLVYIPLSKQTEFLTDVYFQTNASCKGTLYDLPCDKVKVSYNPNYIPSSEHRYDPVDHIYCLNGSSFVFNMKEGHNGTNEQVWVFTDLYAKLRRQAKYEEKIDCNNPPPDSYCHEMVNGTASIPVNLPEAKVGQYYYVLCNPSAVSFHVKRYYYNYTAAEYAPYRVGPVNQTIPLRVNLRHGFGPTDIHKPSTCLLMHAEYVINNNHYHYVTITAKRRFDLLLWVGLPLVVNVVLLIIVTAIHVIVKIVQFRRYNQREPIAGPM